MESSDNCTTSSYFHLNIKINSQSMKHKSCYIIDTVKQQRNKNHAFLLQTTKWCSWILIITLSRNGVSPEPTWGKFCSVLFCWCILRDLPRTVCVPHAILCVAVMFRWTDVNNPLNNPNVAIKAWLYPPHPHPPYPSTVVLLLLSIPAQSRLGS